jgi:hypothetical protein
VAHVIQLQAYGLIVLLAEKTEGGQAGAHAEGRDAKGLGQSPEKSPSAVRDPWLSRLLQNYRWRSSMTATPRVPMESADGMASET